MYFPFFRCKQYELLAIRESISTIKKSSIIPILEPVRNNFTSLKKCLKELKKEKIKFVLVTNPAVGELKNKASMINKEILDNSILDASNCLLAHIIGVTTDTSDISHFLKSHKEYAKCLIHSYSMKDISKLKEIIQKASQLKFNIFDLTECGDKYIDELDVDNKIELIDTFKRQSKNANYPKDDYFSDRCFVYKKGGFLGYGDFLMVGKEYVEVGGPAHVVTIHFIYPQDNREIRIKHFSSDKDSELPINPGGKFQEALVKLINFLNQKDNPFLDNDLYPTSGEFLHLHSIKHFPGLGVVKKLSMKHHMETIAQILSR